jgi:uncharacterized protein YecT (DUF1311 family)
MPTDRPGEPWPQTTPADTSTAAAADPEPAAAPATAAGRRSPSLILTVSGVVAALALGLLFGLWARPELASVPPEQTTPAPQTVAQVPVVVAPPAEPEPPPRAPGRLETLPPDMVAAARSQILPSVSPASAATETAARSPAPSIATYGAGAPEAAESRPQRRYAASYDCATARPGAEEMVCEDPALAAADRRLARAYERAMRAGVDPDDLRQEQRDWTAIREDAAMRSPRALAQVYDQRIEELDRIVEASPDGPPQ